MADTPLSFFSVLKWRSSDHPAAYEQYVNLLSLITDELTRQENNLHVCILGIMRRRRCVAYIGSRRPPSASADTEKMSREVRRRRICHSRIDPRQSTVSEIHTKITPNLSVVSRLAKNVRKTKKIVTAINNDAPSQE
jgi:hypothetical protein